MGDEINRAGANETRVGYGGFTELHLAAVQRNNYKVDALLREGNLNVKVATSDGITALHIAAYRGFESIVTSLLHWYSKTDAAGVNARDNVLGRTALHYAVGGGHQRVVKELVRFPGIDICPEDSVQNLTPLLMEVMKPKGICKLDMVRTLIAQCPDQINRAVGPVAKFIAAIGRDGKVIDILPWKAMSGTIKLFPSDMVLQTVSGAHSKEVPLWEEYLKIEKKAREKDGSLSEGDWEGKKTEDRQRLERESKVQDTQSKCISTSEVFSNRDTQAGEVIDHYLTYKCSMAGHTIFHLAATQDNAEVLSHLLSLNPTPRSANRPSADVNILTAYGCGMTPLHCAIRAESMETFDILMSHREVDVNAVLKSTVDLARPQWTDLTLYSWWTQTKSERFRFYKATCVCDTPLHLAIRCCSSLTLRGMVMKLCNHSRFQPSIYNECGVLPLDLAWLRSSCSLQFGNSSVHLQSVLDVLERQPGNEPLMNEVNSMKHGAQNSVNAVLVAAALLGGVTFNALLQPPFNTELYRKRAVHFFWTFNCMSFYFSMYTILSCLGTTITTQQHTQRFTGGPTNTTSTGLRVFFAHEQAQLVVPLIFCVVTGVGAFVGAGYGNLHQDTRTLMTVCTILGLLLVFIQAARRIFYTFKLYRDVKVGVKNRDDHLWYLVKGVFIEAPRKLICMPRDNRKISHEIPLDQNDFSRDRKMAILAIHVWTIVGMTILASVS